MVEMFSWHGKVWRFLKTLKVEVPYDLALPLLGIYPEELKAGSQREICTLMFILALFTVAKIWKQPTFSLTHRF